MTHRLIATIAAAAFLIATPSAFGETTDPMTNFHPGTAIAEFGKVAAVPNADFIVPENMQFRIAFDTATGKEATLNRTLESAARFLNMTAEATATAPPPQLAVVIHGAAVFDVVDATAYSRHYPGAENPNAALIDALQRRGVRIIVCGQSAAALGVSQADLLPRVELALSAMTAHAVLQQSGYTANPF